MDDASDTPRPARLGDEAADADRTLDVLTDDTARAALLALEEPRTAKEVASRCEIGLSTAYRKLDDLVDAGLCRERIAVRADGHHVTRHERAVESIDVDLGPDGVTVGLTPRESTTRDGVGGTVDLAASD